MNSWTTVVKYQTFLQDYHPLGMSTFAKGHGLTCSNVINTAGCRFLNEISGTSTNGGSSIAMIGPVLLDPPPAKTNKWNLKTPPRFGKGMSTYQRNQFLGITAVTTSKAAGGRFSPFHGHQTVGNTTLLESTKRYGWDRTSN